MKLSVWTYEGPPHVGAMRIAASMHGVHYVLHAPQGDTYADLLFTMIERRDTRPPVTYTTFQARDLGSDTAELFKRAAFEAYERFRPDVMLVGSSCTAELIQDDPGGLARALDLPVPIVALELPAYQRKENWGASETLYHTVRAVCVAPPTSLRESRAPGTRPRCNIIGATSLGFRSRDDVTEIRRLLTAMGVEVVVAAPLGAHVRDLARLPEADFNVLLYPEIGRTTVEWLKRTYAQPYTQTVPIGVGATRAFVLEVAALASIDLEAHGGIDALIASNLPWYSRSIDSTYLTGKRVFIFGDATHAIAAARIARDELGYTVAGLGSYSREQARDVRDAAATYGVEALITDDYLEVEAQVIALAPELVLGTQMERHIAKRLGIPCAVISGPFHVQDAPARYSPHMGPEGSNVIFDAFVHPLMMGLEEHLLTMFSSDFEFAGNKRSHLHETRRLDNTSATDAAPVAHDDAVEPPTADVVAIDDEIEESEPTVPLVTRWVPEAERELSSIPFFVRGKARRNTERFAAERGLSVITLDTLYEAKAHFGR